MADAQLQTIMKFVDAPKLVKKHSPKIILYAKTQ